MSERESESRVWDTGSGGEFWCGCRDDEKMRKVEDERERDRKIRFPQKKEKLNYPESKRRRRNEQAPFVVSKRLITVRKREKEETEKIDTMDFWLGEKC